MQILFFGCLLGYFLAMAMTFIAVAFKKKGWEKVAQVIFVLALLMETVYLIVRGVVAKRLPLSNQFEFATAFSWGVALMLVILWTKWKALWLNAIAMPMVFFLLSYAALLPREITELMPALRSGWFGFHISSAVISHSAFALAGCTGLGYIFLSRKGEPKDGLKLRQMDYLSYRLAALGVLMLTVTILTGAFWAEQAWGSFWSWDPKEVWALITWIIYVIYLHLRLVRKREGLIMAWFLALSVPVVLFTFAGVNVLMSGLHSYA